MRALATTDVPIAWLILVALTVVSWITGTEHGWGYGGVIILLVAGIKVRLVGLYFMELKSAPHYLRSVFETYVVVLTGLLVGILLWG